MLRQASQAVHPFAIDASHAQSSAQVEAALHQALQTLTALHSRYTVRDNQPWVDKFTRQIAGLASLVDAWWQRVEHSLLPQALEAETQAWLLKRLLPAVYWHAQLKKTKTPTLKSVYQRAFNDARATLVQHPFTSTLTPPAFEKWQAWATEPVAQFQRASSPVEGRNGYLSQLNHCARGTPTQRLKVMTVIHNFDLKREDETTAAQRLFGTPFPDLFDWVVARMGALPMPRKPRTPQKPKPLNLQTVPA